MLEGATTGPRRREADVCGWVIQNTPANAVANPYEATMGEEATLFHPGERTPGETTLGIVRG